MSLGLIGKTPREGPEKLKEEFVPDSPKTRLPEFFESKDWTCADGYSLNEVNHGGFQVFD